MLGARKLDRKRNRRDTEHFRSHGAQPGPGGLVSKDSRGEIIENDPVVTGNEVGIITSDVSACTYGSGEFTPGTGIATIFRRKPGGPPYKWISAYGVTVFNSTVNVLVAAPDKLVQIKRADVLWVDVRDCD